MRRTPRASASRLCADAWLVGMRDHSAEPGPSLGRSPQPGSPDTIGSLVAAIANVNQKLQDLGAAIQAQQESVNKAIVDVQTARDNAAAAQQDVDASSARRRRRQRGDHVRAAAVRHLRGVDVCQRAVEFVPDRVAIRPTSSTPRPPGRRWPLSSQQVIADLQRARTEQVNKESAARLAKQKADQATGDAQASQDAAVSALTSAQQTFRRPAGPSSTS